MVLLLISQAEHSFKPQYCILPESPISAVGASTRHMYDDVNAILFKRGRPVGLVAKAITDDLFSRKIK